MLLGFLVIVVLVMRGFLSCGARNRARREKRRAAECETPAATERMSILMNSRSSGRVTSLRNTQRLDQVNACLAGWAEWQMLANTAERCPPAANYTLLVRQCNTGRRLNHPAAGPRFP
jgi:hypothetical protein